MLRRRFRGRGVDIRRLWVPATLLIAAAGASADDVPVDCECPDLQPLKAGDVVYAAVDSPCGNGQIHLGDPGVVVCAAHIGSGFILCEWDIDNGHDGLGSCSCPDDGVAEPPRGWYVLCGELSLSPPGSGDIDCVCDELQPLSAGSTVYAAVDHPQGHPDLRRGDAGEARCGRVDFGGEEFILVEWDIDNGHDGFGACACPADGSAKPGSGWYVLCSDVAASPPDPPCMGDVDLDRQVGLFDLLILLGTWGRCPACHAPFECGGMVTGCEPGSPQCICLQTIAGELFCGFDALCEGLVACKEEADCPSGTKCAVMTCCGRAVCVPECASGVTVAAGNAPAARGKRVSGPGESATRSARCAADVNGDGVVGTVDLLLLLQHWGPC